MTGPQTVHRPATTPSQRTAAAIVGALAAAGTRLIFGVPGGGPNLDLVGAAAAAGLPFVLAHGETAAAIMAATSADLTGAPGAVVVTRGPGLASAVNGIAHAALDRLPLVVIADTVPAADAARISHQRLDQGALGASVAKAALTAGGTSAGETAARAVALALTAPAGPVVLNVDAAAGPGTGAGNGSQRGRGGSTALAAGPGEAASPGPGVAGLSALGPLRAALAGATRPVLLLGTGAAGHTAALRAAVSGSGIPALHTYRSRGIIPDTAEEAAGLFTGGTMEWPLLAAADLIIGLGVDPAELIPASWDYPAATLLVTEVPSGSAGYFSGGTELVAPLPAAIEMLAARERGHHWAPGAGRAARDDAAQRLRAMGGGGAPGLLSPQDVVATVRAHTPPETIATVDAGAHMLVAMPLWEVTQPHRLLTSSGLATMGYALPAAIAAALAAPGRPVVAFTGDGGLGMTLMEIETAVRLRLPVVVVVFNDATLSLIKIKQRPDGQGGPEAVDYRPASFAAVAAGLGAAGVTVGDTGRLAAALATALSTGGPTVIDARTDPASYPAVMDLTRGEAGRRRAAGLALTGPAHSRPDET